MNHATYLLNPGDMFQVEPDAVMYATGMPKPKIGEEPKKKKAAATEGESEEKEAGEEEVKSETVKVGNAKQRQYAKWQAKLAQKMAATGGGKAAAKAPEADEGPLEADVQKHLEDKPNEDLKKRLRDLALQVRGILKEDSDSVTVKRKQRLREYLKRAKTIQSDLGRKRKDGEEAVINDDVVGMISQTLQDMAAIDTNSVRKAEESGIITMEEAAAAKKAAGVGGRAQEDDADDGDEVESRMYLSRMEQEELRELADEIENNPLDPSKPYRTPWAPRNYMSAFAFIPRYLEVNPNICAAVYLRHPVARQGMAEIPSPFPTAVQELAFNWYLRRR